MNKHALGWRDLQTKPVPHYLNRQWKYEPAASHSDSSAFRQRQQERMRRK